MYAEIFEPILLIFRNNKNSVHFPIFKSLKFRDLVRTLRGHVACTVCLKLRAYTKCVCRGECVLTPLDRSNKHMEAPLCMFLFCRAVFPNTLPDRLRSLVLAHSTRVNGSSSFLVVVLAGNVSGMKIVEGNYFCYLQGTYAEDGNLLETALRYFFITSKKSEYLFLLAINLSRICVSF